MEIEEALETVARARSEDVGVILHHLAPMPAEGAAANRALSFATALATLVLHGRETHAWLAVLPHLETGHPAKESVRALAGDGET